jgi:hypothetical protein
MIPFNRDPCYPMATKHMTATAVMHTTEELLDIAFSILSKLRLYREDQWSG